jgi:hypothetical protein
LRRLDGRAGFAATFLAAAMLAGALAPPAGQPQKQLLRWTRDGHDWLLVADRRRDSIQAYDARDGRPLGTLDRTAGLGDVDRMLLEGRWLVVLGSDGPPKVVSLPEFRARPLGAAAGDPSPARRGGSAPSMAGQRASRSGSSSTTGLAVPVFRRPALRSASRSTYSICALTLRSSSSDQRCMASSTLALIRSG